MIAYRIKSLSDFFTPNKILALLCLFLLVLPKGGIKLGGIPVTWGYLILGIVSLYVLLRNKLSVEPLRIWALVLLLPFQSIFLGSFWVHGVENFSFACSLFISFFFLPIFFFFILSKSIENLDFDHLCSLFKKGIFFISIYGILLFFFKLGTGNFIEIPLLTTNLHDLGELDTKCNDRGFLFKLISTYNNGNLYGISLLIFSAFYSFLETKVWKRTIVKASLILTFSRTVWLGLIFNELLHGLLNSKNKKSHLFKIILSFAAISVICVTLALIAGFKIDFFFDADLGGRLEQFEALSTCTFFPSKPYDGIPEVVYLGILDQFGILGLISYLTAMIGPLFLSFINWKTLSPVRLSILAGQITFLFISCSDGALLYIPVMAFYWFSCSLALRKTLPISSFKAPNFNSSSK